MKITIQNSGNTKKKLKSWEIRKLLKVIEGTRDHPK